MLINMRNALLSGGKRMPTAKDYVQDGLVAMWDGIENAGWGIHDTSTTVWKNLVSNLYDISLNDNALWNTDSITRKNNTGNIGSCPSIPYNYILQFDAVFMRSAYASNRCHLISIADGGGRGGVSWTNHLCQFQIGGYLSYCINTQNHYGEKFAGYAQYEGPNLRQSNNTSLWVNNVLSTTTNTNALQFGNTLLAGSDGTRIFDGNAYCFRVYSRHLTADEIAANCAIDKARFNLPDA